MKKFKFYHFVLVHFALMIATYIARECLYALNVDDTVVTAGRLVVIAVSYLAAYVVYKYIDRSIDRANSQMASE